MRGEAHGPFMQLARFDIDAFLRGHWQKRPMLIRNPWAGWRNPLEPDELAGLACEEGVEARLILGAGERLTVEEGPLPEDRFAALSGPWTLLVQAVDQQVPDVAALIAPFRFVPDWRIDDVMVSYATEGGGVGAHFDQYDVFLVQGRGRRRWRVGALCDADTPLLPHDDLRLLADFEAIEEWLLEPGDILYVPPGFAHEGVAVGDDCMTYSVGFRAPSVAELVEGWSAEVADGLTEDARYADPDLVRQEHVGEIDAAALDRLHAMMLDALADRQAFARWFGAYNSQPKYGADWRPEAAVSEDAVRAALAAGQALERNPASRFAFIRNPATLFVDGEAFDCPVAWAEAICGDLRVDAAASAVVAALINQGSLAFEDRNA